MFDPFGDGATRGYLRNVHGLPQGQALKRLEHLVFNVQLPDTLAWLSTQDTLGYPQLLETHRRLFGALYPWAGQDRAMLSPSQGVRRGEVSFANPGDAQAAVAAGLRAPTPGKALGYLAYAHPFLEGNGRALFTFFSEHLRRQHLRLAWDALNEDAFLEALGRQVEDATSTVLDTYLQPHLRTTSPEQPLDLITDALAAVNWSQSGTPSSSRKSP